MSTKCYMIVLVGQGDTFVKFVNKETWDWISNLNTNPPQFQIDEYIKNELDAHEVLKTPLNETREYAISELMAMKSGSTMNDRALFAQPDHGCVFYSLKEAMSFAKDEDIDVLDTFEGYIY